MIKKMMVMLLMVLFATLLGAKSKVIPLPDMMKPELLFFDNAQMYVTEGTSIYIYSLKDFKLVKKFGKRGEGPREFMINPQIGGLTLDVQTEDIIISSFGKVSWFTKDGTYKKEQKYPEPFTFGIQSFGKKFVGVSWNLGEERWLVLNLYDDKFNVLKEITRQPHPFQPGKGTYILENSPTTAVYDNKLFFAWEKDFIVKVLDLELKELYTIKFDEKKRKVTEEEKKEITEFLKVWPATRDVFEFLKPLHFPEYYPSIAALVVTGNKIYVLTFKENKAEDDECMILDLKGKRLKRIFLPLKMSTPILPYPYMIHEGSLYQVVEDEEEEEWALHVTEIK